MKQIDSFTYKIDQLDQAAQKLKDLLDGCRVLTFTGPLGAGKTTLVKSLLATLGVSDDITSPTFTYVNRYALPDGRAVFHFDLYRIESADQFLAMGFDEYLLQDDALVLIEWPLVIVPLLERMSDVCHVGVEHVGDDERRLTVSRVE